MCPTFGVQFKGCAEHKVANCLRGFVFVFTVAEALADGGCGIRCQRIGGQLQIPLAAQSAGNQGFGGAKRTAFAAAYAPASGFLVSLGILRVPQPHGQPFAVAFTGILLITAVVLFFQTAFVGGLLFFQLFGCRFGTVAPIGADGTVDDGSRSGDGLLFVE